MEVSKLSSIVANQQYARFIHTNLHMHTPVTAWDWDGYEKQTVKAKDITPEIYFDALNQTSLQLVAITDHNCVEWCEPLIELAKNARKNGKSKKSRRGKKAFVL